ncbi:MAG: hypothetical protein M3Y53_07350 [Thermoproteota archaeon]|nr:hypothetical protein [Thermoproteota archaeon]
MAYNGHGLALLDYGLMEVMVDSRLGLPTLDKEQGYRRNHKEKKTNKNNTRAKEESNMK